MKKLISLITVCLLLVGLCACGSSEPSLVGTSPANNSATTNTPPMEDNKTFKLGDVVELNGVVVSFLDVTTSTGSDFNEPSDGNVFVLCEFEIANNSSEELSVSSMLSFEAYCDGYACEYSLGALMANDKGQLDGSIAAGKKMKGVIGYEVPTDWKELEVQYTANILSDDKIIFVATNS